MLTVQESSGLYQAVQYDGTNGVAIFEVLRGTDYSNVAGVLSFRSFIMRAGGLLTSGHRFNVAIGEWLVWVDDVNPYVIGGPLSPAEFEQQYQVAASAAEIAALQAEVTALGLAVSNLSTAVDDLGGSVTGLSTSVGELDGEVTDLSTALHNSSATWITTGVLAYQRLTQTIPESQVSVLFNRPTLVTPGTAQDTWQMHYNGSRTIYGNEYNLLRVRGVPEDQVVARFMSNFARDGLATGILQATLSNATSHLFQVLGNGDILSVGGLSMLPTAPVAVTFSAAGAANATAITDGTATSGTPYPVTTTLEASNNRVHLDGSMTNTSGVAITAQTTLFIIAAAHRPTAWTQFTARTSNNLACRVTVKGATGAVCLDQQLAAAATISFDGANWRKA